MKDQVEPTLLKMGDFVRLKDSYRPTFKNVDLTAIGIVTSNPTRCPQQHTSYWSYKVFWICPRDKEPTDYCEVGPHYYHSSMLTKTEVPNG